MVCDSDRFDKFSKDWRNLVRSLYSTRWAAIGSRLVVILAMMLALLSVACQPDSTATCFALGEQCTEAEAYSISFAASLPCCEGVCTDVPAPDDGGLPVTSRECLEAPPAP